MFKCYLSPDIEAMSPPNPTSHPANEFREHINTQIDRSHRGNFTICGGTNDIDTCVGEIAGRSFWVLDERDNPSSTVQIGDATGRRLGVRNSTIVSGSPCCQ